MDVTTSTIANKKLTRVIDFEGEGVNILSNYDASSGVTTISIEQSSEALNQVGIITGVADSSQAFVVDDTGIKFETTITDSGSVPGEVNAPIIKFSGSNLGFGVRLNAIYPPSSLAPGFVGVTTIEYQSPIFPINFGTNSDLPGDGSGAPVFSATPAGRTDGTRVIYRETIGSASVDFAKGLVNNILWESVAQNSGNYGWHYYAGETLISRFSNSNTFDSESYSGSNSNFKWNYIFGFNDAGGDGARVDIETNGIVKARVLESFAPNGEAPFTLDSITETPFLNAAVVSRAGGIPCRPDVNNVVTVNVNVPGGTVQAYNTIPVRQVNGDGQVFINANSTGLLTDEGGTITGRPGEYFLNEINSLAGVTFNTTSGASVTGVSTFFAISDVVLPNATSFLAGDNTLSDGDLFIDSGAITVNFLKGPVCRIDGPTTATLLSIVNVPTLPNRTYNYTVIINSSTSTSVPYQLQVNGTTITPSSAIQWLNGESPESGGGVGTFLVGFTFLCDNNGDFNSTSTEAGRGTRVLGVFGSYTGS